MKVMNFQLRTELIRLFIISNFPSIVKDELAALQQRDAVQKTAETRITYDTLLAVRCFLFCRFSFHIFRCVLPLSCSFLVVFFIVIGIINPFHKHFSVVNFGSESIF